MAPKPPPSERLAPDAPMLGAAESQAQRSALSMPISWRYKSNVEAPKAYREFIQEEEPELEDTLPSYSQTIKIEPESTRERFLDSVRIAYKMDAIKANIYEVTLNLASTEEEVDDQELSITITDWSTVKRALWESTWDPSKSAFTLLVRQAEDGEIIWESDVPLAVQQVIWLEALL